MNAVRPLTVTATVIAVALTLAAAPSQAASNLACKRMVWGQGVGASRRDAIVSAAGQWVAIVSSRYGRAYANGHTTANGRSKCAQTGGNWRCALGARPCKASFQGHKPYQKQPRRPRHRRTR